MLGWVVLGGAVLLVGVGVWWVVGQSKAQQQAGAMSAAGGGRRGGGGGGGRGGPPAVVNTAKVEAGDMPVVLAALGTVTPTATVTIKPQLSGQLMSVGFKEGQMVRKGQFLAQIDPRPYEQQLAQAEAVLAKDQALLANAQLDLKRYQTLFSQDSVARQQLDTQQSQVRQLEAQIKSDQAAVSAQKLNLTYARITAPVSGRVGLRQVDAGNYVTPGDANGLVTIAEVAPIDVAFTLPEDSLPKVNKALHAGAKLSVEVYDRAQTSLLAQGELTTLDNLIDTTTGTVRAKARFANADGALFPNQFVNVKLTVETLHNAPIAPTSAVLRGSQGMFVYVVDAQRQVHMRPVKPGPAQGERTAITAGVTPGETVVTDGTDRLRDGMTVITPGDCPPAGGFGGMGRKGGGGGMNGGGKPGAGKPGGAAGLAGCRPGGGGATTPAAGASASATASSGAAPASASTNGPFGGSGRRASTTPDASGPAIVTPPPMAGPAPGGGGGGAGGGAGRVQAMLAELNLDATQQAKADEIFGEARQKAMASMGDNADPDARRAAMRAVFGEAFGKLAPYLRPDQKAKLAEIRARAAQNQGQGGGPQQ